MDSILTAFVSVFLRQLNWLIFDNLRQIPAGVACGYLGSSPSINVNNGAVIVFCDEGVNGNSVGVRRGCSFRYDCGPSNLHT